MSIHGKPWVGDCSGANEKERKRKEKRNCKKDYQNQKLNQKIMNKFGNKFESQELINVDEINRKEGVV